MIKIRVFARIIRATVSAMWLGVLMLGYSCVLFTCFIVLFMSKFNGWMDRLKAEME